YALEYARWKKINASWRFWYDNNPKDFHKEINPLVTTNHYQPETKEWIRFCKRFWPCGVLEYLVHRARQQGKIPKECRRMQAVLDKLAMGDEFREVLNNEVHGNEVALHDAMNSVHTLSTISYIPALSDTGGP
ncbi:unnamed protein product, partial [Tuber aestivum]